VEFDHFWAAGHCTRDI